MASSGSDEGTCEAVGHHPGDGAQTVRCGRQVCVAVHVGRVWPCTSGGHPTPTPVTIW